MKKDFIVKRSITMVENKPHVETYSEQELVRCKDCGNKKCWERTGDVVCGIDGNPHEPDWFCAYGERK